MAGKQHKREIKRQKELARQAAAAAERRRSLITGGIVGLIVVLGGALIFASVNAERVALSASETPSPPPTAASTDPSAGPSADPSATAGPTAAPGEVVPDDPTAAAGSAVSSGQSPVVDAAVPLACGAEEPAGATRANNTFPGGPAQVLAEGVDYRATIATSCGTVVLDLREDSAPVTVNSFAFLAQEGFFDGQEIFRNATGIGALQTGSGSNEATWQIGYRLPDELALAQAEGYPAGSVAMANSGPNSGGSQFFFVYNDSFDAAFQGPGRTYARFADVVEGLDVLQTIGAIATGGEGGETPQERVYLESVTITDADGNPVTAAAPAPTATAPAPTATAAAPTATAAAPTATAAAPPATAAAPTGTAPPSAPAPATAPPTPTPVTS